MTLTIALLVFLSAVVHTAWSVVAKRAPKTSIFYSITIMLGVLLYAPFCVPSLLRDTTIVGAWPYFAISGFFLAVYYMLMAYTYEHADISLAYPLLRVSPIFSTIWAMVFLLEEVTPLAMLGILATVAGCMILPLRSLKLSRENLSLAPYFNRVYLMALLAALATSFYIVIDKHAMDLFNQTRSTQTSINYVFLEMAVCGFCLAVFALFGSTRDMVKMVRTSFVSILLIAPMLLGAYVLIMIAFAQEGASAAHVGAFRLVSVILTVVAGIVLLKEGFGKVRIVASVVILIGLLLIGLG